MTFLPPRPASATPLAAVFVHTADKRHITYDAGLVGLPRNQVVAKMVDWLDQYLGPTQE